MTNLEFEGLMDDTPPRNNTLAHLLALLDEQVSAHIAYAADRPWMQKPNPITLDVADVSMMLDAARATQHERKAMANLEFTPALLAELKKAYAKALDDKVEVFAFQGSDVLVGYAKYMIEYLEGRFK